MVIIMSKVLIVVGSRREGNSYHLAKKIKNGLKRYRIPAYTIVPGNQKIYLCTGCMDCDRNGVCDFTDDMKDNIEKVLDCDTIIFITPTRWNLLSGDIKIFMDRLNPLYASNKLKNKNFIGISIAAEDKDTYSSNEAVKSLTNFSEKAGMKTLFTYEFNHCLNFRDILKQEEVISKLIQKIANSLS